jgi:hypothetical protein
MEVFALRAPSGLAMTAEEQPGLTVLVVEDHRVAADSLANLLRLSGHRPSSPTTGRTP